MDVHKNLVIAAMQNAKVDFQVMERRIITKIQNNNYKSVDELDQDVQDISLVRQKLLAYQALFVGDDAEKTDQDNE